MFKLKQMLFPSLFKPRLHGLALERHHLVKQIERTEATLSALRRRFHEEDKTCCYSCAFHPTYGDLCDKQERRTARLGQIDRKLATSVAVSQSSVGRD